MTIRKNGLVYTSDSKCVLGIDGQSDAFRGAVPNGAEAVGEEAFSCCGLTQISLPDSVVSVGANTFGNSERLESVRLPAGLRTLAPYMFSGCTALKRVEMPVEVDGFPEGLFSGCASLPEIPFRAGIRSLPAGVVEGCASLTSLVIPDSVTEIAAGAISGCGRLKTIVFPANLKSLADGAVSDCPALERVRISEENESFYTDEDGRVLYRRNADGTGTAVLEAAGKIQNAVPAVREADGSANPSIINYEEAEDDSEEVDVIFNSEGSHAAESAWADDAAEMNVEERLAEIMKQDKQYISGDFSIMDIPEASEEELAADCLAPSSPEEDGGAQDDSAMQDDSAAQAELDAAPEEPEAPAEPAAEAAIAEDGFVAEDKSVYGISDEEPAPSDGSE
ncbi:MAG: leucine-rich repeat domain-containing protein, partial [Treponemataceae bacterium]|nr:leucine-rich repeat domain-containing protein [Treponemataceae bacterium]